MYVFLLHFWILWIFTVEPDLRLMNLANDYVKKTGNEYNDPNVDDNIKRNVSEEFCMFVIKYKNLKDFKPLEFLKHIAQTVKNRSFTRKTLSYPYNFTSVSVEKLVYDLLYPGANEKASQNAIHSRGGTKATIDNLGKKMKSATAKPNIFLDLYIFPIQMDNDILHVANALKCVCGSLMDESCRYTVIKFENLNSEDYLSIHENYVSFIINEKRPNVPLNFRAYKFYKGDINRIKDKYGKYSSETKPDDLDIQKVFGSYKIYQPKIKISKLEKKLSESNPCRNKKSKKGLSTIHKIDIHLEDVMKYSISIIYTCIQCNPNCFTKYKYEITGCVPGKQEKTLLDSESKCEQKLPDDTVVLKDSLVSNMNSFENFLYCFERMLYEKHVYNPVITNFDIFFYTHLTFCFLLYMEAQIYDFIFQVEKTQEDTCKEVAEYLLKSKQFEKIEVIKTTKIDSDTKALKEEDYVLFFSLNGFYFKLVRVLDEATIGEIYWTGKILLLTDTNDRYYHLIFLDREKQVKNLIEYINGRDYLAYTSPYNMQKHQKDKVFDSVAEGRKFWAKLIIFEAIKEDSTILLIYNYLDLNIYLNTYVFKVFSEVKSLDKKNDECVNDFMNEIKHITKPCEEKALAANDPATQKSNIFKNNNSEYLQLIDECKNELEIIYEKFLMSKQYIPYKTSIIIYHTMEISSKCKVQELVRSLKSFEKKRMLAETNTSNKRSSADAESSCKRLKT